MNALEDKSIIAYLSATTALMGGYLVFAYNFAKKLATKKAN